MSDEQPGSEQQGQFSAQPEPPAGDRWGDPISEERQAELKALADQQRAWAAAPDHQGRASYFESVPLTGADVWWLAAYALTASEGNLAATQDRLRTVRDRDEYIDLSALHLERANLSEAHLEWTILAGAHLEGAVLYGTHLETLYVNPP